MPARMCIVGDYEVAMTTAKTAHWNDAGELTLGEKTVSAPGPGQVQLAIGSVGICGSDLHFYRGQFPPRAGITPGHELAGTVAAVGGGVKHVKEGDLVGVEPLLRCGACLFCASGDYHVCDQRRLVGEGIDGGMAERANVPANTAYKAPPGVDAELGALAEPLACSVHGFNKVDLRGHQTVFIVGAGSIGLTAILAARANGADVVVLARHPHQQQAALRLGATEVIGDDEAGEQRMDELMRQHAIDVAVETVGGQGDTLLTAQRVLRPKGKLVVLGVFTQPEVRINALHLALREIEIVGSMTYAASGGRADYQTALEVIADAADAARTLVTHRFALADVNDAFGTALDKSTRSLKVHINPNQPPQRG